MTLADALVIVNGNLAIGAAVTRSGETVKCWVPSTEGGVDERYLNTMDCRALAEAFACLAAETDR